MRVLWRSKVAQFGQGIFWHEKYVIRIFHGSYVLCYENSCRPWQEIYMNSHPNSASMEPASTEFWGVMVDTIRVGFSTMETLVDAVCVEIWLSPLQFELKSPQHSLHQVSAIGMHCYSPSLGCHGHAGQPQITAYCQLDSIVVWRVLRPGVFLLMLCFIVGPGQGQLLMTSSSMALRGLNRLHRHLKWIILALHWLHLGIFIQCHLLY